MDSDLPDVTSDSRHRILVIIGVSLAIIFFAATIFAFLGQAPKQSNDTQDRTVNTKDNSEKEAEAKNTSMLVQTPFLFAKVDTTQQKTEVYKRPAGADRSDKIISIDGVFDGAKYTRLGTSIAFAIGGGVYVSSDEGTSFKTIYNAPAGEEVTSLRFSKHKAKLLVAVTSAYGAGASAHYGNQVYKMEADGSKQQKVMEVGDVGLFIRDWSVESGSILYQSGCNRCDQASRLTAVYSMKTKKTTTLPIQDGDAIGSIALNDAGTKVIYGVALHDSSIKVYGSLKDSYYGPPYTIHRYDIQTKQDRVVTKLGKRVANPKSYADIPAQPLIATAGTKYGRQYYYVYNSKITLLFDDNHTEELMDSPANLQDILFVSEDQVLATIKTDSAWKLVSFNPKNNQQQTLFEASHNDIPLGISDQF